METKFDAHLRRALRGPPDSTLQVLIELDAPISDDQRAQLEDADLREVSGSNRIVTASGVPEAIRRAAALVFVRTMSLSRERPPLD